MEDNNEFKNNNELNENRKIEVINETKNNYDGKDKNSNFIYEFIKVIGIILLFFLTVVGIAFGACSLLLVVSLGL